MRVAVRRISNVTMTRASCVGAKSVKHRGENQ